MQLSQTLHSLTNIKITVARRQQWRHPFWDPEWNHDEETVSEKLDDFAYAIRNGINNCTFANEEPRPMIEVEGRLPRWWQEEQRDDRAILRIDEHE